MSLVPIHNHSEASSLDGFATPREIAERCVEIGATCCGLTDHGVVSGHLDFAKELTSRGIKPIFGVELYHGLIPGNDVGKGRDQAHLIVLAETDEGLKNLWRLVNATSARDHFHQVGRSNWDDLEKYRDGLIVTSACPLGLVPRGAIQGDYEHLNHYLDIFGDNFFIEIHTYPIDQVFTDKDSDEPYNMAIVNEALIAIAQERGLPLVYANDAHYAFKSQYPYHDLYLALQTGQTIFTPIDERKMWHPEGALAIMNEEEVRASLEYLPQNVVDEAIANSNSIGERIDAHLPAVSRHLPIFVPSESPFVRNLKIDPSQTAEELFVNLVERGIHNRYGDDPSLEVWDRTIYEVETLIRDKIHHYFLMGWDEIQYAHSDNIEIGPGRGSSSGSIVAYALGITDVDPIHYGLIFERFWNSGRASGFPDIDSDFSRSGRPKIREYLIERWGEKRVCSIGNVSRMKPKAVVDRLHKGCGISYSEAAEIKKIIDGTKDLEIYGPDQIGWDPDLEPGKVVYVKEEVGEAIDQWTRADPSKRGIREEFIKMCEQCCSRIENYGVHASGIVISDIDLDAYAPAYNRGGKEEGIPATMFPMADIDKLGLVKLDVLGLATLDTLDIWKRQMVKQGVEINWSGLDKEDHPDGLWDLLADGAVAGIFQIEQGYPKDLCKRMKPRSVEDLAVIVALNRPGPIGEKIPESYIARRNGLEEITYPHPILESILKPTYGLFVYQEQVIAFYNAIGYTLSESDAVRSILGKKKPEALAALYEGTGEWEGRAYPDMAIAAGIPKKVADSIWKTLERFAAYSFNKPHAVAYGIICFRTAFAKYYGPAEWYAACIQTVEGKKREKMLPKYVTEGRSYFNIHTFPPDIRFSESEASVIDGDIFLGFSDIKGVANSGNVICKLREGGYDISTPESFMKQLEESNKEFLVKKKQEAEKGIVLSEKSPKQQVRQNTIQAILDAGAWDGLGERDLPLKDVQSFQSELLGVVLTDNIDDILEKHEDVISPCDDYSDALIPFAEKQKMDEAENGYAQINYEYKLCGIVTEVRQTTVKKTGAAMAIVTIALGNDELTFAVFSHKWAQKKSMFRYQNVGIFRIRHTGPTEKRDQEGYSFEEGWLLK
jgi:DNA polymerase-3 subunit alpha